MSSEVGVTEIVTRFPNLEVGLFALLLDIVPELRQALNIGDEYTWRFVRTSDRLSPAPDGVIYFDAGGGIFDQHNSPNNASGKKSSIDLVLDYCASGGFVMSKAYPWLNEMIEIISKNDINGKSISRDKYSLREIMTGMTVRHANDPAHVLNFLRLSFASAVYNVSAEMPIADVFSLKNLQEGVRQINPKESDAFIKEIDETVSFLESQWAEAVEAVKKASYRQSSVLVNFHGSDQLISFQCSIPIVAVVGDSVKIGCAARRKKAYGPMALVIQKNSKGQVQIYSGKIKIFNSKKDLVATARFDLTSIHSELQRLELKYGGDSRVWYLTEYKGILNGSLSSPDVLGTVIHLDTILATVQRGLSQCPLIFDLA